MKTERVLAITVKTLRDLAASAEDPETVENVTRAADLIEHSVGGWRFDVENAPKDGTYILGYWHAGYHGIEWARYGGIGTYWKDGSAFVTRLTDPVAWCIPQPPAWDARDAQKRENRS